MLNDNGDLYCLFVFIHFEQKSIKVTFFMYVDTESYFVKIHTCESNA